MPTPTGPDHRVRCRNIRCVRRDHYVLRAFQIRAQPGEVRMIENVEDFGPELRLQSLIDGERFCNRHIDIAISGAADRIAPHIAKRSPLRGDKHGAVLGIAPAGVVRGRRIIGAWIDAGESDGQFAGACAADGVDMRLAAGSGTAG